VPPFVDVNQDDLCSPIDVLMIINQLARRTGEGESVQNDHSSIQSNSHMIGLSTPAVRVGSPESMTSAPASETTRPSTTTSHQIETGSVSQSPFTQLLDDSASPLVDVETPSNSGKTRKQSNSLYEDQVDIAMSELYSSVS
jgi:hypothetical protein